MSKERTFLMLKPDAVQRGLIGPIISRLERRGLHPVAMKFMWVSRDLAKKHYAEHVGKPFFEKLVEFITSGPVLAMVWEGENAVALCRKMMGKTDPQSSEPGTIRGDFGISMGRNIIHGSDSLESANREISLWFTEDELIDWDSVHDTWIYEH